MKHGEDQRLRFEWNQFERDESLVHPRLLKRFRLSRIWISHVNHWKSHTGTKHFCLSLQSNTKVKTMAEKLIEPPEIPSAPSYCLSVMLTCRFHSSDLNSSKNCKSFMQIIPWTIAFKRKYKQAKSSYKSRKSRQMWSIWQKSLEFRLPGKTTLGLKPKINSQYLFEIMLMN
jgi:hypothetical protein